MKQGQSSNIGGEHCYNNTYLFLAKGKINSEHYYY